MLSKIIKDMFFIIFFIYIYIFFFFFISDSGRSDSDSYIDIDSNSDSDNRYIDSVLTCFHFRFRFIMAKLVIALI